MNRKADPGEGPSVRQMNALQNAGIGVYYNLMNYAIMRENPEKISFVLWERADFSHIQNRTERI